MFFLKQKNSNNWTWSVWVLESLAGPNPEALSWTQKEVEEKLKEEAEKNARTVTVEDRAVQDGDEVIMDFEGFVDGVAFEGGKGEDYPLTIGSGAFIPGFEDQLVGHKAGETVEVNVTFPEEYHAEDLKGKDAVFETTIHEVKTKELPELDDEFAKDVDEEVDTLVELKAKTRERLEAQKQNAAKEAIQEEVIDKAVENAEIGEIPGAMIEEDVHRQMDQYLAGLQQQGISADMYYKLTGSSEEDLHKQFESGAQKRVKTNLVLEAIVAAEDIKASEEEINAEIKELAAQYGMEEAAVRSALSDDMLNHDIAIRKVVKEMTDSAKQV